MLTDKMCWCVDIAVSLLCHLIAVNQVGNFKGSHIVLLKN